MPKRTFTVTFDVAEDEFENFMTRLAGGAVHQGEIPRNLVLNTGGDDDDGPVNAEAGATDKFGVPWDARFHGKAKNLNGDGTWRRIKGLSDALKADADAYEAGAREAAKNAAAAPVAPVAALPTAEPVAALPVETPAPVAALPVAPAPVVGLPGGEIPGLPMPTAPVAPAPISYEEVVAKFQAATTKDPSVAANWQALYADAQITDPNSLKTDETARRRLADKLDLIING